MQRPKVKEKRRSAVKHFDFYIDMKNKELLLDQRKIIISRFSDIKFDDINTGDYLGEYANYLAQHATRYCKKDAISVIDSSAKLTMPHQLAQGLRAW